MGGAWWCLACCAFPGLGLGVAVAVCYVWIVASIVSVRAGRDPEAVNARRAIVADVGNDMIRLTGMVSVS